MNHGYGMSASVYIKSLHLRINTDIWKPLLLRKVWPLYESFEHGYLSATVRDVRHCIRDWSLAYFYLLYARGSALDWPSRPAAQYDCQQLTAVQVSLRSVDLHGDLPSCRRGAVDGGLKLMCLWSCHFWQFVTGVLLCSALLKANFVFHFLILISTLVGTTTWYSGAYRETQKEEGRD